MFAVPQYDILVIPVFYQNQPRFNWSYDQPWFPIKVLRKCSPAFLLDGFRLSKPAGCRGTVSYR